MSEQTYPDPSTRNMIAASSVVATIMCTLDGTIANVALPHMQAGVSASREQIVWVLTSYLVASVIATPLSGWLADRFGRKRVMLISLGGFVATSVCCGLSMNLGELVLFRLLQGFCGAGIIPLTQATLLDINPRERHGRAMASFGMGAMLGPIIGPTLGGYITDALDWRWIFFINVPVGTVAFLGLSTFMPERRAPDLPRFDFMGFAFLSIFIAAFQLVLDRGQEQDWFSSTEICIEAVVATLFFYCTVVHMMTARHPFIRPILFTDRNFTIGMLLGIVISITVYGIAAMLAPMLQQLMGYSVVEAGLVTMPRGIGSMITMYGVSLLLPRGGARLFLILGLLLGAAALYLFAQMSLEMDDHIVLLAGFVQGLSTGVVFVSMTTLTFSTLPSAYRNAGSAVNALGRNLGGAVGISVLQTLTVRNSAVVQSRLVEGVRPDNPVIGWRMPEMDFAAPGQVARIMGEVVRQATMVGYVDSFWFLFILTLVVLPLVLLMRPIARRGPAEEPMHLIAE